MTVVCARTGYRTLTLAGMLALGGALWGCAPQPSVSSLLSTPSYDGHYVGTVQMAGAASGIIPAQCQTNPAVSFDVKNNSFSYAQPHPVVVGTAPSLTVESTTTTYHAMIYPDGTIRGESGDVGGTISGKLAGPHMSGQINGVLCYYSFNASRM